MADPLPGRPGFLEWLAQQEETGWPGLPLTHITKGLIAEDILRSGKIDASTASGDENPSTYFFYGRAAYRCSGERVVKIEAACPYCFIFSPSALAQASYATAFDTGAFRNRMYGHVLTDEMREEDFRVPPEGGQLNKVIKAAFSTIPDYLEGNRNAVTPAAQGAKPWEMTARAYLELLSSPGRNEPDDRICSIEITMSGSLPLEDHLMAVIAPHTHWSEEEQSPWLSRLNGAGVSIRPYIFIPGRSPDYYHAILEAAVKDFYQEIGVI